MNRTELPEFTLNATTSFELDFCIFHRSPPAGRRKQSNAPSYQLDSYVLPEELKHSSSLVDGRTSPLTHPLIMYVIHPDEVHLNIFI